MCFTRFYADINSWGLIRNLKYTIQCPGNCFLQYRCTHLLISQHLLTGGEEVYDVVQEALVHLQRHFLDQHFEISEKMFLHCLTFYTIQCNEVLALVFPSKLLIRAIRWYKLFKILTVESSFRFNPSDLKSLTFKLALTFHLL